MNALTEALKLKLQYPNAVVGYGVINTFNLDKIIKTVPVGPDAGLKKYPNALNAVYAYNTIVVYRDVYGQTIIALPVNIEERLVSLIGKITVHKGNGINTIIDDILKRKIEASLIYADKEVLNNQVKRDYIISDLLDANQIIYYTDDIDLNEYGLPEKGFYLTKPHLSIVTSDAKVANDAVKYIIELQGLVVYDWEQFKRAFNKLSDIYGLKGVLGEWFGNNILSYGGLTVLPEIPIYLSGTTLYFKDFKVQVKGGEVILQKGVAILSYNSIYASPDVWDFIKKNYLSG